jgi:hypothetical protein
MTEELKRYIGTKEVEARLCTADEADEILGKKVCRDNADEQGNGYLVRYKDGYMSWSPAKAFEEAYLPVEQRGKLSDGYHTFDELYEFRKMYNALLFNEWAAQGKYSVHKSKRHFDGGECFGGGWFIVVAVLPTGQISNHYEMKDWDLFDIRETERALCEFDGHTGKDVISRLSDLRTDLYIVSDTCAVRERIQEISELMSEVSQHPVGTAACEIELTNKLSILLELQKQKNELTMFLERLQADVSYSESIYRAMPASCSSYGVPYEPSKTPGPEDSDGGETQRDSLGEKITKARAALN